MSMYEHGVHLSMAVAPPGEVMSSTLVPVLISSHEIKKFLIYKQVLLTLALDDLPESVEEALVPGLGRRLVVDELDLDGLHGGHGQDGLADPRPQAAE